jgi:hypothetical protein
MRELLRLRTGLAASLLALCGAATAAADNRVAVIAMPGAQPTALSTEDLALVYRRRKQFVGGQRVQPLNLPSAHPLRRFFSQQVLQRSPEELEDHWRDLYFNGIFPPFVLASEEAVLRFVATTPGAVGYVPLCLVDKRVAVVAVIDGGPPCPR